MTEDIKSRIYRLLDAIEDEHILQMVAADITYYTADKDITDCLDAAPQREWNEAMPEGDNNRIID